MELLRKNLSFDWEFLSSNWEKSHPNCIGNGALFRPLRHQKKIPVKVTTSIDFSPVRPRGICMQFLTLPELPENSMKNELVCEKGKPWSCHVQNIVMEITLCSYRVLGHARIQRGGTGDPDPLWNLKILPKTR